MQEQQQLNDILHVNLFLSTHLNIMWGGGDSKWIDIYHRLKGRYWTEESYNIFQNINVDQWTENTQSEPYILLYVQYTLSTVYMYVCVCVFVNCFKS